MSRVGLAASLIAALLALSLASAHGEGWHSAQPPPPPPPEGQTSVGVPIALGHIGEISFWAPNRGLLITAGTEAIKPGLYYYDGVQWRQLANVCGGTEGRIAWAGPDDFWTISDQQAGQLGEGLGNGEGQDRSLCHFAVGPSGKLEVVASYAEPIGVPGSYQSMDAAACSEPSDCWFAGGSLPAGANSGAFHLHWNGTTLTPVPSLQTPEPHMEDPAHNVTGLVFYKGRFYESVKITPGEPLGPGETHSQPAFLHKIIEGASSPFAPLPIEGPLAEKPLQQEEREEFKFSGPGAFLLSADSAGVWALSDLGTPTLLLLGAAGQFQQVRLSGLNLEAETIAAVAAEPGTDGVWVSIDSPNETSSQAPARVIRLGADGHFEAEASLPEAGEALGGKGPAGTIACPGKGDCWLATREGWLFHLGGSQPANNDPAFETLIESRPRDASIPTSIAEESFPEDDSGGRVAPTLPADIETPSSPPARRAHRPLFSGVSSRVVDGSTLALSFTLAARSRVRLLALRRKRTVAATKRRVLAAGRHTLDLKLARRDWPTKLDLQVKALAPVPLEPSGGGGAVGGPTVVTTSLLAPATGDPAGLFAPSLFVSPLA